MFLFSGAYASRALTNSFKGIIEYARLEKCNNTVAKVLQMGEKMRFYGEFDSIHRLFIHLIQISIGKFRPAIPAYKFALVIIDIDAGGLAGRI
jgi:hypothetical protein